MKISPTLTAVTTASGFIERQEVIKSAEVNAAKDRICRQREAASQSFYMSITGSCTLGQVLGQGVTSAAASGATTSHNRNSLGDEIKLGMEEVRNKRIMSGAFQNYDQKSPDFLRHHRPDFENDERNVVVECSLTKWSVNNTGRKVNPSLEQFQK